MKQKRTKKQDKTLRVLEVSESRIRGLGRVQADKKIYNKLNTQIANKTKRVNQEMATYKQKQYAEYLGFPKRYLRFMEKERMSQAIAVLDKLHKAYNKKKHNNVKPVLPNLDDIPL